MQYVVSCSEISKRINNAITAEKIAIDQDILSICKNRKIGWVEYCINKIFKPQPLTDEELISQYKKCERGSIGTRIARIIWMDRMCVGLDKLHDIQMMMMHGDKNIDTVSLTKREYKMIFEHKPLT